VRIGPLEHAEVTQTAGFQQRFADATPHRHRRDVRLRGLLNPPLLALGDPFVDTV
jgi:hypothetical protein